MRRRNVLTLAASLSLTSAQVARAQRTTPPLIGTLGVGTAQVALVDDFQTGLAEQGYSIGRNLAIESRYAEGLYERLPALARELVALDIAVLVAFNAAAAQASKQATSSIPIVFNSGADPVALGLVASLARPGGNATGVYSYVGDLPAKRLEVLRDVVPKARRIAFLVNTNLATAPLQIAGVQEAARSLGFELRLIEARNPSEIEPGFARLANERPDALLVASDPMFFTERTQIVGLAARHALVTVYDFPDFVVAGGLMSYGPSLKDQFRIVGTYTGRILRGTKPADLPVQQPSRFELVINLRTAKILGLQISPSLLARADEVIE